MAFVRRHLASEAPARRKPRMPFSTARATRSARHGCHAREARNDRGAAALGGYAKPRLPLRPPERLPRSPTPCARQGPSPGLDRRRTRPPFWRNARPPFRRNGGPRAARWFGRPRALKRALGRKPDPLANRGVSHLRAFRHFKAQRTPGWQRIGSERASVPRCDKALRGHALPARGRCCLSGTGVPTLETDHEWHG